jgi:1-acyl-sn-glycerol-3-phosphate acyltransferase
LHFLRSLTFNIAFYLSTTIQMIVFTPVYFIMPRKKAWIIVHNWARSNMWLMRVIMGLKFDVSGTENIPDDGCIIAPKHQSAMDTFCFLPWLDDPVLILKRELMWIPLFGWYVGRMKMIPIDRGSRDVAIRKVNDGARIAISNGRQLLIYPEGTRRKPGDEPAYKSGIAHIYKALGVPVVPIAHNAGLFWPKGKTVRHGGTFKAEFLPPIPPGLPREEFMARLITETETACHRLLAETAQEADSPPMPETAKRRLALMAGETTSDR